MHRSSFLKMTAFRDCYLSESHLYRVLDVGSREPKGQGAYRQLFADPRFEYVGLDLEPGANVDIVPNHAYKWAELEAGSFDAVISGQTFEHNPFFWITMAEVARVLRPNGVFCVIAPSKGQVHRVPLDCWRFYPDAATAMFAFVGLEILENHIERSSRNKIIDTSWGDMFAVGRRPVTIDLDRLQRIVDLAPNALPDPCLSGKGLAIELYESRVRVSSGLWCLDRLKQGTRKISTIPFGRIRRRLARSFLVHPRCHDC